MCEEGEGRVCEGGEGRVVVGCNTIYSVYYASVCATVQLCMCVCVCVCVCAYVWQFLVLSSVGLQLVSLAPQREWHRPKHLSPPH